MAPKEVLVCHTFFRCLRALSCPPSYTNRCIVCYQLFSNADVNKVFSKATYIQVAVEKLLPYRVSPLIFLFQLVSHTDHAPIGHHHPRHHEK